MSEVPRHFPARELEVRAGCIRRHQLDRGGLWRLPVVFGEKHSAELRTARVLLEFKRTVDNVAFPLLPGPGHRAPLSPPPTPVWGPAHSRRISPELWAPHLLASWELFAL